MSLYDINDNIVIILLTTSEVTGIYQIRINTL